jgi:NADH-quinone oxidoreductase subunit N
MFSLFFTVNSKTLVSLTSLKLPGNFSLFKNFMIVILLTLAGTPPFVIFTGKFYIISKILFLGEAYLGFFIILLNLVVMYFYIQNLRLMVGKKSKIVFMIKDFFVFIPKHLVVILFLFNYITWFAIFFIQDIYIYTDYLFQSSI